MFRLCGILLDWSDLAFWYTSILPAWSWNSPFLKPNRDGKLNRECITCTASFFVEQKMKERDAIWSDARTVNCSPSVPRTIQQDSLAACHSKQSATSCNIHNLLVALSHVPDATQELCTFICDASVVFSTKSSSWDICITKHSEQKPKGDNIRCLKPAVLHVQCWSQEVKLEKYFCSQTSFRGVRCTSPGGRQRTLREVQH